MGVSGGDANVLGTGALEFGDHHGQAVEVENHVEPPLHICGSDDHLVDRKELVFLDRVAHEPDRRRLLDAVGWPWSDDASRVTVIVLVVVIIGVSAWDVIDGFLKAWRNRRTVPRL